MRRVSMHRSIATLRRHVYCVAQRDATKEKALYCAWHLRRYEGSFSIDTPEQWAGAYLWYLWYSCTMQEHMGFKIVKTCCSLLCTATMCTFKYSASTRNILTLPSKLPITSNFSYIGLMFKIAEETLRLPCRLECRFRLPRFNSHPVFLTQYLSSSNQSASAFICYDLILQSPGEVPRSNAT
jgi:hypothetical protein